MNCNICNNTLNQSKDSISNLCSCCNILFNLKAEPIDYSDGGGQDVPEPDKSKLRFDNADKRFEIILPHVKNHNTFVDIGCGSGDMLECSKKYFDYHFGYDENKKLIRFTQQKKLNTFNKYFSRVDYEKIDTNGIVVSINHVLEHIDKPIEILSLIKGELNSGDLIYIEVPLHSGQSFKKEKYNWSLWYEEHLALYSMNTLKKISELINCEIVDFGFRNFISDNYNRRTVLSHFIKNPIVFLYRYFTKRSYQMVLDNYLRDYGFILLRV